MMTVSSDENVGIGEENPYLADTKLIINTGSVSISRFTECENSAGIQFAVNNSGKVFAKEVEVLPGITWPDYVFEGDYNLMNLEDLESFLNENKHLPNVPSATDVKENGINLGEMDNVLLMKIEELTLYIIQQQKYATQQQEQIEELQRQINELKK